MVTVAPLFVVMVVSDVRTLKRSQGVAVVVGNGALKAPDPGGVDGPGVAGFVRKQQSRAGIRPRLRLLLVSPKEQPADTSSEVSTYRGPECSPLALNVRRDEC